MEIQKITNANVYDAATSLLGKIAEMELPNIEYEHAEHNALGMVGVLETFSGVGAMEATVRCNSMYNEVLDAFSNPTVTKKLQLRSQRETWNSDGLSEQVPIVVHLNARAGNMPLGSYTSKENVELEFTLKITAVKLVINGVEKYEFDAENNIFKINGEDILSEFRSNIGN